ncbi:uncharacterized protein PRCAT00003504001 [Priceomyces carsonii]|uniref:uncharacterized protein n=1 Tax=Priceomyces carsonii TaxID=28549 RepID=UPI002EDB729F|nr:unnamed protein product [Priceomyces carsonii]
MGQQVSTDGATEYSVETPFGVFKGLTIRDKVTKEPMCYRFTNIRYANQVERWKMPEMVSDNYDYSKEQYKDFGKVCPQPLITEPKISFLNNVAEMSEDCTYLNIWAPFSNDLQKLDISEVSKLPVLFYIHGGWLQYGNANHSLVMDPRSLLASDKFEKFVIVAPAYRLNSLGFMSCSDLLSEDPLNCNFGFWDQRTALLWTAKYIKYFGGDSSRITVGGLSAGSYSTFFQLAYELYHPEEDQLIKQVIFFSNCLSVQPKSLSEADSQFKEYCEKLGIEKKLSGPEKLKKLRSLDVNTLIETIPKMRLHTFRAVSDDDFVSSSLLHDLYNGTYARMLSKRAVRVMIGEVDNEPILYSYLNSPCTRADLSIQLENYYPKNTIATLISLYYPKGIDENSPSFKTDLRELFGQIIADTQVYASSRGFLNNITKHNHYSKDNIFRYKVSYAPQFVREMYDKEGIDGVIHGGDQILWFYAIHNGVRGEEETIISEFIKPFVQFIYLKDIGAEWGTSDIELFRYISANGEIYTEKDTYWNEGIKNASRIYNAQLVKSKSS